MESAATKNRNQEKEMATKTYASFFVVAALLATTSLYAGFAMIRHVQSDYGSAMLTRKAAFITFAVADGITLIASIVSSFVALRCWMNVKRNGPLRKSQKMAVLYYSVIKLALIAMLLGHICGTYVLYGIRLLGMIEMVAFYFFCSFAMTST